MMGGSMNDQEIYSQLSNFEKILVNRAWFESFLNKLNKNGVYLESKENEITTGSEKYYKYTVNIRFFKKGKNDLHQYKGRLLFFTTRSNDCYFKELFKICNFTYLFPIRATIFLTLLQLCLREFNSAENEEFSILDTEYNNRTKKTEPQRRDCLHPDDYFIDHIELIKPYLKEIRKRFGDENFINNICSNFNPAYEKYISKSWSDDYKEIFRFFTIFIELSREILLKKRIQRMNVKFSLYITREFLKKIVRLRKKINSSSQVLEIIHKPGRSIRTIREWLTQNGKVMPKFLGLSAYQIIDILTESDVDEWFDLLKLADRRFK